MSRSLDDVCMELSGHCSVCGHFTELFQLPGRKDKYCLGCSADVATARLLIAEIDAATLAGQNADTLISECAEISNRILERAQSPELET
jgi:hypothetical protein